MICTKRLLLWLQRRRPDYRVSQSPFRAKNDISQHTQAQLHTYIDTQRGKTTQSTATMHSTSPKTPVCMNEVKLDSWFMWCGPCRAIPLQRAVLQGPDADISSPAGWGLSRVTSVPSGALEVQRGLLYACVEVLFSCTSISINETVQKTDPTDGPPHTHTHAQRFRKLGLRLIRFNMNRPWKAKELVCWT